jgi:hypothetical protein
MPHIVGEASDRLVIFHGRSMNRTAWLLFMKENTHMILVWSSPN